MFLDYLDSLKRLLDSIECTDVSGRIEVEAAIGRVLTDIERIKKNSNKMMWIGNGGSAAIASHSALDYFRTGSIKTQAFNDGPQLTCIGNDFGYASVFQIPIEAYGEPGDILIAISSSGKSANILNAVEAATKKGCQVITLSGFGADNPLRSAGHLNFYAPVSHYGYVELIHGVLCHSFLDLFMEKQKVAHAG